MKLRLYVVPGSHPCAAVEKALQLKGLNYRVWEWPPPLHAPMQLLMTGRRTVPSLRLDGEHVSGSKAIMRRLDQLVPEPPLFPSDQELRARVEAAEAWGDETFQPIARELIWAGAVRRPEALLSYGADARLRLPDAAVRLSAPLIARAERLLNRTDDQTARRRLAELPAHLDRIDAWLADGTLNGPEAPNAADLQILSTVRLIGTFADARAFLAGRPCEQAARELWPQWAGELPAGAIAAA
ncbi:MAG TPA: glutathione S-transferase N-terminal domain-containing protein [Solirubrobacteraceae bacterium]|nr:glutathione S-transferase N-terminal domain-containing protein [Solirubrobacteraceae bacterium]